MTDTQPTIAALRDAARNDIDREALDAMIARADLDPADAECVDCDAPCRSLCICVDTLLAEDADLDPAAQDVAVRYLLVALPLRDDHRHDPEKAHDDAAEGLRTWLPLRHANSIVPGEPVAVSQVFPGHVVVPDATVEHEKLRAMLAAANDVANDPGSTEEHIIEEWLAVLDLALTRWPGVSDTEPAEDENGHCDTCGAFCDEYGCITDRAHVAAIEHVPAPTWPDRDDVDQMIDYSAWQAEVANGDTVRGFRDWLDADR